MQLSQPMWFYKWCIPHNSCNSLNMCCSAIGTSHTTHTNTTTKHNMQLCNTSGANLFPWTFSSRYRHILKHYDYRWNCLQSLDASTKVLFHQHAFSYNLTKTNNFDICFLADMLIIWGSYETISNNIVTSHFSSLLSGQINSLSWKQSNKRIHVRDILFRYECRLASLAVCFKPMSSMIITLPCCV